MTALFHYLAASAMDVRNGMFGVRMGWGVCWLVGCFVGVVCCFLFFLFFFFLFYFFFSFCYCF